jgi:hypothetical protein
VLPQLRLNGSRHCCHTHQARRTPEEVLRAIFNWMRGVYKRVCRQQKFYTTFQTCNICHARCKPNKAFMCQL